MKRRSCLTAISPLAVLLQFAVLTSSGQTSEAVSKAVSDSRPMPDEITNSIGMKLKLITVGEFMMGSTDEEVDWAERVSLGAPSGAFDDEKPQHRVVISKPLYVGVYEVTVGQYRKFVRATGYKTAVNWRDRVGWNPARNGFVRNPSFSWDNPGFPQTDDHPVVNLDWCDAVAFCQWLSEVDGRRYRLPTEAEWEYACRAGTRTRYYCGDDPTGLAKVGNVADASLRRKISDMNEVIRSDDGYCFTAPVGQYQPNAFGLYDMHGNVWEWCLDGYLPTAYENAHDEDSLQRAFGSDRVTRGGSWMSPPAACRASRRERAGRHDARDVGGFRVIAAAEDPSTATATDKDENVEFRRYVDPANSLVLYSPDFPRFRGGEGTAVFMHDLVEEDKVLASVGLSILDAKPIEEIIDATGRDEGGTEEQRASLQTGVIAGYRSVTMTSDDVHQGEPRRSITTIVENVRLAPDTVVNVEVRCQCKPRVFPQFEPLFRNTLESIQVGSQFRTPTQPYYRDDRYLCQFVLPEYGISDKTKQETIVYFADGDLTSFALFSLRKGQPTREDALGRLRDLNALILTDDRPNGAVMGRSVEIDTGGTVLERFSFDMPYILFARVLTTARSEHLGVAKDALIKSSFCSELELEHK